MARDVSYTQHGREITKTGFCTVSGKPYSVTVTTGQFIRWRAGEKIQNVMPDLDADQREFWISNNTPDEFNALFPDEDEEE